LHCSYYITSAFNCQFHGRYFFYYNGQIGLINGVINM